MTPADLRAASDSYEVLFCWRDIVGDASGPSNLLKRAFESDGEFLETLEALRHLSSSAQNGVPRIPESYLKYFADTKAVHARMEELSIKNGEEGRKAAGLLDLWWHDRDGSE